MSDWTTDETTLNNCANRDRTVLTDLSAAKPEISYHKIMATSSLLNHLPLPGKHMTSLPPFIYGTAWKKDLTTSLVQQALQNGFTAIDTACQPRHYREDLVGEGMRKYLASTGGRLSRSDLYIQSKFTSINGQDPNNVPYNPKASLTDQVQTSIETSLRNFTMSDAKAPYLDSLILHSPMPSMHETLEVWQALEQYVPEKIRNLGISNTNLYTLMELYERASVKPAVVQNRFYADTKYDIAVRQLCAEKGMVYQSFWTLTANPQLLRSKVVQGVAKNLQIEPTNALYCLVLGLGNTVILNGTKSEEHMRADWEAVAKVREYATGNEKTWTEVMGSFRKTIGEKAD
ncbi:hypothetical protein LTR70_006926 [Exophiala xenobiotica]|uniref:NADP-dependent oxidoreductase domain-containing protein n=1 Tax=Lithohypha guttulata TaxID=1690604 RepID=A0ABR0K7I5_9EURO|nr:hypothetical protein LTR24_006577 [Lithohypha guttulata]KAK5314964.1 hypothetical protein LTR70_006926 [Exophiala xenobiotica]